MTNKTKITEIVEGVLSTSQLIDEGQEQVTDIIKKVANNQTFKAQFSEGIESNEVNTDFGRLDHVRTASTQNAKTNCEGQHAKGNL